MQLKLANVLKEIYEGGLDNKDDAMIIRKIHQALEDMFFEEPPSHEQQLVLRDLLKLADRVEKFFD
jgi:hypothetical protein